MIGHTKRQPYRNKKILEAARGEECTLNFDGCNYDPATTVFAHLNESWAGKGMGQKADDCAGAFMCSACHAAYDANQIPLVAQWLVLRAYYRTVRKLLDVGAIK